MYHWKPHDLCFNNMFIALKPNLKLKHQKLETSYVLFQYETIDIDACSLSMPYSIYNWMETCDGLPSLLVVTFSS